MQRSHVTNTFNASALEGLPWPIRGLLGCCASCLAVGITYSVGPFRAFPLLLAFPTVVLSSWFLGMWGGVLCGITDAVLVDAFLTKTQYRFSVGFVREEIRLTVFLLVSVLLGWAIRRLAEQRALLATQELEQRLILADAERQLAEERARASETLRDRDEALQLALRVTGMGRWVWDVQHTKVDWSEEVYRIMGHEPGSIEPGFETWGRLIHPEDAHQVGEALEQASRGVSEYRGQFRVIWPDGSVHWVEAQGKGQVDSAGRVTRVVGVLSDVTQRKLAEEAMLRAEKLAVAGRLAASVAHEINNPLEAVTNLLYLIGQTESTDEVREHAQLALDEVMRISMITQQTLKFHRQTGKPKLVMLSELVQTVLALFRAKLTAAQIEVEVRVEREAEVAVMPGEIQQVFANLLTNAIEAMPSGGRLVVRLQPSRDWRDSATPGMRATFCDSGVGMDRATMQRIFEPFFTTKMDTGTGLGMWVVAQLVERHRGHVRVWSTHRNGASGTAFSVFLPVGDAAAVELAEASVAQAGAA
jgi:PAS domain S-box-containing protein